MKNTRFDQLALLEDRLGYHFHSSHLLDLALTHSSYANEHKGRKKTNNERLEFLGDAVLELVVSSWLFRAYPTYAEGQLTKLRASLVCEYSLAICAREMKLGDYLLLSRGEDMTGGRERDSILSDAYEAVIGAIYLDGGFDRARKFIERDLLQNIEEKTLFYDAKTILQEMIQGGLGGRLTYQLVGESGPDHDKKFRVEAQIDGKPYACGEGKTKKSAEQVAAYQTILLLKNQ